jgi:hypothetical protein
MKPFTSFRVHIRPEACDRKWVFLRQEFRDVRSNRLHAIGIGKIVFKQKSGKTIPPRELFAQLGYKVPAHLSRDGDAAATLNSLLETLAPAETISSPAPEVMPLGK